MEYCCRKQLSDCFLERPERVVISIVIVIVMVSTGQGYLHERVEDEVAKGEDVQGWSIAVSGVYI